MALSTHASHRARCGKCLQKVSSLAVPRLMFSSACHAISGVAGALHTESTMLGPGYQAGSPRKRPPTSRSTRIRMASAGKHEARSGHFSWPERPLKHVQQQRGRFSAPESYGAIPGIREAHNFAPAAALAPADATSVLWKASGAGLQGAPKWTLLYWPRISAAAAEQGEWYSVGGRRAL